MGLKETFQIGKILIDSKNPDIVYVGALGPTLRRESRARHVQNHRWRQDLDQVALRE